MRPNKDDSFPEETGQEESKGTTIEFPLPIGGTSLFRHEATEDILTFLGHSPDVEFSVRTLGDIIGYSEKATRNAVDALESAGVIQTERRENKRMVSIDRTKLNRPDDPILSIPQTPYQFPTRLALRQIRKEMDEVLGVVLFGSVARGEADRQSDIDLWVLVEDDRAEQLHIANKISNKLDGTQIPPKVAVYRRMVAEIGPDTVDELGELAMDDETEWASAQRHSFEILVETPETVLAKQDEISDVIFVEGITLHDSETLEWVKREVLAG